VKPFNNNGSENYLHDMLMGIYGNGKIGGGGKDDDVFPGNDDDVFPGNDDISEEKTAFKDFPEIKQMEILYNYMKDRLTDDVYKKEGYKKIADNITLAGNKCGKDIIEKVFKILVDKHWIGEIVELNKSYKLLKEDI
jgi:hypothetical protein